MQRASDQGSVIYDAYLQTNVRALAQIFQRTGHTALPKPAKWFQAAELSQPIRLTGLIKHSKKRLH